MAPSIRSPKTLRAVSRRPTLSLRLVYHAAAGQHGCERHNWRDPEPKGFGDFIAPDALVFEAIEMMDAKNVGALLVVKGEELLGIISERDYTRRVFLRGKRSRETRVEEIMSRDVTITTSNEPVENCMRLMTEKRIRHLPVVDNGKLRGVLSIGDLVKHIISTQSATIEHLESYIHGGYR